MLASGVSSLAACRRGMAAKMRGKIVLEFAIVATHQDDEPRGHVAWLV